MAYVEVNEQYKLTKKKNNGLVYSFYWWVGYKLAFLFKVLKITPNTVSWFSIVFYTFAGYLFIQHNYILNILGGVCFYFGVQMDATDGKLARITNKTSKLGVWLDYNFDNIRPLFIYPLIAYHLYIKDGEVYWFFVAFVAMAVLYTSNIVNMCWDNFDFASEEKDNYVDESKFHKYLKQFYFLEGIEPLAVILFFSLNWIELYLICWTAGLTLMYVATAFFLGNKIRKKDLDAK